VYSYGQAQREQIVRLGTVVSVRAVTIQEDQSSGVL
jgi:outer membrane lipoprotein SlyB